MSQADVELVRKATNSWNSGGVEALLSFYTEDVVWYPFVDAPENPTGFNGHAGIRELTRGWNDSFDEFTIVPHEIRDLGDTVVALGEVSGIVKGSKAAVHQPFASIAWD